MEPDYGQRCLLFNPVTPRYTDKIAYLIPDAVGYGFLWGYDVGLLLSCLE